MSEDNKLKVITKPPLGGIKRGIALNRQNFEQQMKSINPNEVPNRLGIVMDDSSSMGHDGMENAHKAIKSFTNSCNPKDTSIAVFPLNAEKKTLLCDYDIINMYVNGIWATGGTPIYTVLKSLIETVEISRAIVFSDGSPTDSHLFYYDDSGYGDNGAMAKEVVGLYIYNNTPVDTIFIGQENTHPHKEMQKLAEMTGGTCIVFKDTQSLSTGLKYLAPKYRALLSNADLKKRIENGEQV